MFFEFITSFKNTLFIYFRERGKEGERAREISMVERSVASYTLPPGDPACNQGMCPYGESNQRYFGLQPGTQSTEPHQPVFITSFFMTGKFSSTNTMNLFEKTGNNLKITQN